jgi:hypothetical protein
VLLPVDTERKAGCVQSNVGGVMSIEAEKVDLRTLEFSYYELWLAVRLNGQFVMQIPIEDGRKFESELVELLIKYQEK